MYSEEEKGEQRSYKLSWARFYRTNSIRKEVVEDSNLQLSFAEAPDRKRSHNKGLLKKLLAFYRKKGEPLQSLQVKSGFYDEFHRLQDNYEVMMEVKEALNNEYEELIK